MKSQPGYQTITIQILLNISRSKHNQAMKIAQLIEYNMRKNSLDKFSVYILLIYQIYPEIVKVVSGVFKSRDTTFFKLF